MAALAVERFRQEKGEWPQTLVDLTPFFLDEVPLDPANGERIGYATNDKNRAIVYAQVEQPDAGHLASQVDPPGPPPAGIVVHLLAVKERRLGGAR